MLRQGEEVLHREGQGEDEKPVETIEPISIRKLGKLLYSDKDFYNYADYVDIACLCVHKMLLMSRVPHRLKVKTVNDQINRWSGISPKAGEKTLNIEQFYRKVGS